MKRDLLVTIVILITTSVLAGSNKRNNHDFGVDSTTISSKSASVAVRPLVNKTAKFLWREDIYDPQLKGTYSTIVINKNLCKTLSDPERAALGFVVTFIGSECNWDGKAKDDRSNLKCKALSALRLGYQCSEEHLGFLRKWFANDSSVIEKLKDCPTIPYTASDQETFDYINLTVKGNLIAVEFRAIGVYLPDNDATWSWTETDYFRVDKQSIKLMKKKQSKVNRS